MSNQPNKKSKSKSKSKTIILTVIISLFSLLILIPGSIYVVRHNYSIAKILPLSKGTKTRAFWDGINSKKLEKLKKSKKIAGYDINDYIYVSVVEGQYSYTFQFNKNGGNQTLPTVAIYSFDNTPGNKIQIMYDTDGITIERLLNFKNTEPELSSDDYREISDEEVDKVTKRGLELYNQFIDDYNSL